MTNEDRSTTAQLRRDKAGNRAVEDAHAQRGSSAPYGKEEHMNEELARRKESGDIEEDSSEAPS